MTDTIEQQLLAAASLDDVRSILKHQVQAIHAAPELAATLPPLMLWGPPGVGKSTVMREVCRDEGIDFIDIRLAQRDPVDIRGLPVPRGEAVQWLLADDWPRDPDSHGILLFDELTAADRSLQVAVYELILDRRLGSLYQLPDGWLVCGAGNRAEDGAVSLGFSSALANRFCHLELQPELAPWIRWALARGIHPDVIAFLRFRPACFFNMEGDTERGWPSPRSWERVSTICWQTRDGLGERAAELMISGLVGPEVGNEFLAFLSWHGALPDVGAMLRGQAPITIPERADHRYALCAAAVHHLWHADNQDNERLMAGFFRLTEAMSSDFATLALMDALQGPDAASTRQRCERLFAHPGFARWSETHGSAFAEQWEAEPA
ncbi:AAA family ATPase [Methylonatrum kenyense]|uniref:ATP-binding protein n=1 Tax=Methylonatrum kenyense TaxID=455253 RepID=UPI0020C0403F|nr:AAA family ATPase [Methylonatrum kenyense]MCK8514988.1 AAA family ATPase [Methylonatrum kenyense]